MTKDYAVAALLTLVVWGLAGALFGGIFVGLYQVLLALGLPDWQPLAIATVAAAMATSAFYSATPVALVGAMGGVLASIGYLMVMDNRVDLPSICAAAAIAGAVNGGFYAWTTEGSGAPLAKTIAGLLAGLAASGLLWVGLGLYGEGVGLSVLVAGAFALVGGLFKVSERWVVGTFSGYCPHILSAPAVAGFVAAVVGAGVWILARTVVGGLDAATEGGVGQVLYEVPSGFMGGMLGGLLTGAILELLGMPLMDDEHIV